MFSYSILKRLTQETKLFVRYKHKPDHWSVVRKKIHPVDKALAHFDDFYKQVFNKKWPLIREGLLGKHKYVAIINNYGDDEQTMKELELKGAINVRTLFNLEKGYIQDEIVQKKRKGQLKKLLNAEHEYEERLKDEQIDDLEPKPAKTEYDPKKFSLETSLNEAEYDTRRLVDSKHALSNEILYEFIPATKIKGMEDFIPESHHYKLYDNTSKFTINVEREYDIHFPENLNIYCHEMDNDSDFEASKKASTGVLNYYLMDGGSILPVLALDIKPGNKVLDMCAAPGGKSLLAIQTLYPESVVSNDISNSRLNRIWSVYKQFLYDLDERWIKTGKIKLTNCDGREIMEDNFDRILVDVPCTTDRHSLRENDNNIFKPTRIKERLTLPELQSELLVNALKLVRKGGIVVYSTCSLSPIQNDGVVNMALKQIWEETKLEIVVKDLSPALLQCRNVFKFAEKGVLRYGHLVIPNISQNYGPMYFCKLQKIK